MTCNRCFKQQCDCNSDPCGKKCQPAKYGCGFDIQIDPFDPSTWIVTTGGAIRKIKVPKANETDTVLKTDYSAATLNYHAERHTDVINGSQIGNIINLKELRDVDAANPDNCSILTWNPGCSECGHGCEPLEAKWRAYTIPDAGDCELELDDEGYYHVLVKNDCGCIKECKLPVMADGSLSISYIRDSVPDDPDYPWYYGCYNDTINLHLAENAPAFFGKYDLEIIINYGIQVVHSSASPNTNFRSLLFPLAEGDSAAMNVRMYSSTLQGQSTVSTSAPYIPWGTVCMRGSLTFFAPKGKEVSLRHEFRLMTKDSVTQGAPYYATNALDRQKVPDDIAGQVDRMLYTASRLNALQIIVRPARGGSNTSPVVDPERNLLDPAEDAYQGLL